MKDDELLRRYLLGGLSGDDKDRLESRLIQDRSLFELAEAIEDEILDDYSHGLLDSAARVRVRRRFLSSPGGRLRLAVIQGLGKVADQQTTARLLPWPVRNLSRPQLRAAAIAAMLLIGVGSAYLYRQRILPPSPGGPVPQPVVAESPRPTEPVPTPTPITPDPQPPVKLAEREATPAPMPSPTPLVLELALGAVMRGGEELQVPRLEIPEIPAGTEQIELRIALSERDLVYPSYGVTLIDTATGRDVPQMSRTDGRALVLQFDRSELHESTYHIFVQGITADGKEDLIDLDFEIHMPAK